MNATVIPLRAAPSLRAQAPPNAAAGAVAGAEAGPVARPLLDRWFLAWAERAEARWRRYGDLRARHY